MESNSFRFHPTGLKDLMQMNEIHTVRVGVRTNVMTHPHLSDGS